MCVVKNIFSGIVTMLAILGVVAFFGQIVTFLGTMLAAAGVLALLAVLGNFVIKILTPEADEGGKEEEKEED